MAGKGELGRGSVELAVADEIRNRIFILRGVQVILDADIARLYGVDVKRLNEQVKRNKARFPEKFMFRLTGEERDLLWSQNATFDLPAPLTGHDKTQTGRGKHSKYLPYAFTEEGVAMLSAVLRSDTAVKMSIQVIHAFVVMRNFLSANADVFEKLDVLESRQTRAESRLDSVWRAIESRRMPPIQGIFFDGQFFDAHRFVADLFRGADKSIVIIDNYLDDSVLVHLAKRKEGVRVILLTRNVTKTLIQDVESFNKQYPPVEMREFAKAHDRFVVIDGKDIYHLGASLKDLGKRWFAFSRLDAAAPKMLERLTELDLDVIIDSQGMEASKRL